MSSVGQGDKGACSDALCVIVFHKHLLPKKKRRNKYV